MAIIAVAGRKGGVGKSTIVGNLAAEFAAMGRSVAVLDADPQHSLVAWAEQGEGMLARSVEKVAGAGGHARRRRAKRKKTPTSCSSTRRREAPETAYQAALAADLMLLPCGPSPLDLFALKEALSLALKARAERRSKKPRIRFVPSKVLMTTNLGRGLASSLKDMGRKVLAAHRAARGGGRGGGHRAHAWRSTRRIRPPTRSSASWPKRWTSFCGDDPAAALRDGPRIR